MLAFNSEIIDEVKQACEATASEAAEAFSRAFDQAMSLSIGDGQSISPEDDLSDLAQPGLLIVLKVEDQAAILPISVASGLLPVWYDNPDPTGESKLSTLGQELGMTLLPESFMAMEFEVFAVDDLAVSIKSGGFADSPAKLSLNLNAGGFDHHIEMYWPIANPAGLVNSSDTQESNPTSEPPPAPTPPTPEAEKPANNRIQQFGDLPAYGRSLLQISVPVRVILAQKQMKVKDIVHLGVGTIIQFDKSCEDTLDVELGKQRIAEGEAVKIGDKFGLRVTSISMPEERYIAVKARKRVR